MTKINPTINCFFMGNNLPPNLRIDWKINSQYKSVNLAFDNL